MSGLGTLHLKLFLPKGSLSSHSCHEACTSAMQRACVPFQTMWTLHTTLTSWPWERKSPFRSSKECREQSVIVHSNCYFSDTLFRKYLAPNIHGKDGGGSRNCTWGSKHYPSSQGQRCSSVWLSTSALHNYCHLHQQLWGIWMTDVRGPFKLCVWKIFSTGKSSCCNIEKAKYPQ